jgi:hypothetical protein
LILGALVAIAVGAMIGGGGSTGGVIIGIVIAGLGGWFGGYAGYKMIIDSKNQKTCNANFWNKYSCVGNPTDSDADTETDITECLALKNAEYKGYHGVWLKSNTETSTSNVDAFYISSDIVELEISSDQSTSGARLFAKKAVDKEKKEGLKVTGTISGCAASSSSSPTSSSSPS